MPSQRGIKLTVSTTSSTAVFDGNGVTTVFPFSFPFNSDGDIKVYAKDAAGIVSPVLSGFTVAGAGSPTGGSVTMSVAPASLTKLVVSRELTLTQATDLRNQGKFFAETHERAFDTLTMQVQQVAEQVDRAVKTDITGENNPDDLIADLNAAALAAAASASAASGSESAAAGSASSASGFASAASGSAAAAAASAASLVDYLNTTRIDVASASTVDLTSSAPNTRNINITGTTTINGFTVAIGQLYFVRFNAALTLTNSASLVTQTGANITTRAGETCIIRATAANVVEILCYAKAPPFVSAEQTVTVGGNLTIAHGLGAKPSSVSGSLICKTAEAGYSVGDEFNDAFTYVYTDTSTPITNTASWDASNVYVTYQNAAGNYRVRHKSTGALATITPANWRLIVRASR